MRTRNLIASSAQSASREMTNSIAPGIVPSFPATATSVPSSSSSFHTGKKRPAGATNHPWRFKAVHLLDKPKDLDEDGFVPDCAVTDNMILLKSYFELGTGQSESKFRESITEILKQPDHFDFVKRERNKVTTPIVRKSLEWNYKLLEFGGLHSADATLMDVTGNDELGELAKNSEVINLMANCGETSVLQMSTKEKIIQSVVMYEVISKRSNTLGVLDEMSKHPHLFESLFTFELAPAIVKCVSNI
ncbi:hypothetical protein pdam_00021966 [Pocillopora damicornis]|uniref:Uncharacterized protein n=1 Tax=Pocillopora damicornis TaxID=46731 RepID=A0A3M6UDR2_POCDA|nr:hypothetical protein pdam_00021966 [Pocillopora damicornis]